MLLLAQAFLAPQEGNTQILKGFGKTLEKKVEQQVNQRVERRADRAINKSMDEIENAADEAFKGSEKKQPKAGTEPSSGGRSVGFPTGNSNVSISDTYDFTLGISYNIRSGKDKPAETMMWLGGEDYIGMSVPQRQDMLMVMHGANMIAFMEKEKSYMVLGGAMAERIMGAAVEEAEKDTGTENFSIRKIGTERILDYNCDVYEANTSEYTTKLWLTAELGVDAGHFMKAFSQLTKSNAGRLPDLQNEAGGVLLKMEGKGSKNEETMYMEATAVHKQGKRINTKEYKSMGF